MTAGELLRRWAAPGLALLLAATGSGPAGAEGPRLRLEGPLPNVAIHIDFNGATLRLSGAISGGPPQGPGSGLAIVVLGEARPALVMRKERRFGLWLNVDRRLIPAAPSLYAAAGYGDAWPAGLAPEALVAEPVEVRGSQPGPAEPFRRAVTRLRVAEGRYTLDPAPIRFRPDGGFDAEIALPANLLAGEYRVIAALVGDGVVRARAARRFEARKAGIEAWLYRASNETPFLYGLATLLAAVAAGWAADRAFRRLSERKTSS